MIVEPVQSIAGTVRVPGDKSIAHRALMLGAFADGEQIVRGIPDAADVASTLTCLQALGADVQTVGDEIRIRRGTWRSGHTLDAGNSGTTVRLLSGLVAGLPIRATFAGDSSLSRRPMERIAGPLRKMGASVSTTEGHLPITVEGGGLTGIRYRVPVASAQVKSAIMFAALNADTETTLQEPIATRDHSERMLSAMGADLTRSVHTITIRPGALRGIEVDVPGDVSSAAFFAVAAAGLRDSCVRLEHIGVNPTRIGILEALEAMGATVTFENKTERAGEPVADVTVRSGELRAIEIDATAVPALIDELPVFAVAATQAHGTTVVSGAGELRHKESDRIATIVDALSRLGANIEAREDGFVVHGPTPLAGATLPSRGDHRIAMALAVAGLFATGRTAIEESAAVQISYPGFFDDLRTLTC